MADRAGSAQAAPAGRGLRRVRLSAWAREQGIARVTAYRMLRRGILPAPVERSPTGRWYVLLPETSTDRVAFYLRTTRSPNQAAVLNNQLAALSDWATARRSDVSVVVKEVATPFIDRLPKLAALLANREVTEILIENPEVVGESQFHLLVAALAPQGRRLTAMHTERQRVAAGRARDLQAAILSLLRRLYGADKGLAVARRIFEAD